MTHVPRYMYGRLPERSYEVDTVLQDGRVLTALFPIAACGSLGKCGRPMMDLCCHTKKTMFVCICLMSVASTSGRQRNLLLATFLYNVFRRNM